MMHKTAEFDELVEKLMEEWKVPSLSIAVVHGDEIDAKAYGYAKLPNEKCTADSLFDLASASKSTTAAAVACLVDDENYPDIQWKTPVSKILPDDFVLPDQFLTEQVTIEDILSHRTGIPTHDESYLGVTAKHPDNAKSITRNLRNLPFREPLRTKFQYSNIMFAVATHLVETASGEDYARFLHKRLWEPLGMTNTFHDRPDAEPAKDRFATGYSWNKKKQAYVPIPQLASPEGQGAGCIFSSAGDYAKWLRALLKRSPPLSKAAHKELTDPRTIDILDEDDITPHSGDCLYALGLYRESYRGRTLISHDGAVPGFRAKLLFLPQLDWGVVMLTNADDGYYLNSALAHALMDDVLGVPGAERDDWPAFFRAWKQRDEVDSAEEKPDFTRPENPEPLGVALQELVGTYHDAGYKDLVLEMEDGNVIADCSDRCFPFVIRFEHLTGNKLVANVHYTWEDETFKRKGEVRVDEGGKVVAVGVEFEKGVEDFIWFEKVGGSKDIPVR